VNPGEGGDDEEYVGREKEACYTVLAPGFSW
jgi:hypothetical protein